MSYDEKTTRGPFKLKQASAREYLENSESPDFRFKGSGYGLPGLSERAIAKRRKKDRDDG